MHAGNGLQFLTKRGMANTKFFSYNYSPLLDLSKSDFIDLKTKTEIFIPFGEDNYLPTQLNKLSREVPVHRAILNSKTNYVISKGLKSSNKVVTEFINNPNNSSENLNFVMRRIIFDYFNLGNAYIEVVTDRNKSFLYLYHIDSSKVRFSVSLTSLLIHPDWQQMKGNNDPNVTELPL